MYLRTISRRNKDGAVVRYVQLAHNVRHPVSGNAVAEVIHSFGREDQLDRDALARLVRSITRCLGPDAELAVAAPTWSAAGDGGEVVEPLRFVASKAMGGTWALDGLWRRLGTRWRRSRPGAGARAAHPWGRPISVGERAAR